MLPPHEEKMKTTSYITNSMFALFLLLSSCALKEDQAGVSITGNTGKISGNILLSSAQSLARQHVVAATFWDSVTVVLGHESKEEWVYDTTGVDSTGYYEFENLEAGTYFIEATLPDQEVLKKGDLNLSEGDSLRVNLKQGSGNSFAGFETWNVVIQTIPDTNASFILPGCELRGSSRPFPFVDVRLKELNPETQNFLGKQQLASIVLLGVPYFSSVAISIMRPVGSNTQILKVGLCMDSSIERNLEITRTGSLYSCELQDPVDSVQVNCSAYEDPSFYEPKPKEEFLQRLGNFPRDFAKYLSDSLGRGIIINPKIALSNNGAAEQLVQVRMNLDADTATTDIPARPDIEMNPNMNPDPSWVKDIPLQALQALVADTLLGEGNLGKSLNTAEYWGDVQGVIADIAKEPYEALWIPFEAVMEPKYEGKSPAEAWVSIYYPGYEANHDIHDIRLAGDLALVSTQGTCWFYESYHLFQKDSTGTYRHIGNWPIVSALQCEKVNQAL